MRCAISTGTVLSRLHRGRKLFLDAADRARVEEHLARCRRCCGELDFAVELRRMLADSRCADLPDDVLHRLNETLEDLGP